LFILKFLSIFREYILCSPYLLDSFWTSISLEHLYEPIPMPQKSKNSVSLELGLSPSLHHPLHWPNGHRICG